MNSVDHERKKAKTKNKAVLMVTGVNKEGHIRNVSEMDSTELEDSI